MRSEMRSEMRILLILAFSTLMTSSVYAACSTNSLEECKTAEDCNNLNGGAKTAVYMLRELQKDVYLCVKINGQNETTCLGVDSSGYRAKASADGESTGVDGKGSKTK